VTDQQIDRTLLERWTALTGKPPFGGLGRNLIVRYSEPHRRYHTTEHLVYVLDVIDLLADEAADADAVRYAAWFHDAVYEVESEWPEGVSNEERSAGLGEAVLRKLGAADTLADEVGRLVRLTAEHDPAAGDRNGAVLCDADLAVLGGPPEQYRRYHEQVRQEYQQIPDEFYRAGRAAILRKLLGLPELYRTQRAKELFEAAAVANLAAEIAELESAS
jgi:predicted metal-dependent HD superfamily phosphohydrolase